MPVLHAVSPPYGGLVTKKAERLQAQYHLDELRAAVSAAKKSMIRKTYIEVRRWYQRHKDALKVIMPLVTVDSLPRHKVKREVVAAVIAEGERPDVVCKDRRMFPPVKSSKHSESQAIVLPVSSVSSVPSVPMVVDNGMKRDGGKRRARKSLIRE